MVSVVKFFNMIVFYYFLVNEFSGFVFDYRVDLILKISYFISEYNLDGFIIDYLVMLYNFFYSKYCF